MKFVAGCILGLGWLIVVVPIWILGVGFAGEFVFLPAGAFESLEGFGILLLMYAPPLLGGWLIKHDLEEKDDIKKNAKN